MQALEQAFLRRFDDSCGDIGRVARLHDPASVRQQLVDISASSCLGRVWEETHSGALYPTRMFIDVLRHFGGRGERGIFLTEDYKSEDIPRLRSQSGGRGVLLGHER